MNKIIFMVGIFLSSHSMGGEENFIVDFPKQVALIENLNIIENDLSSGNLKSIYKTALTNGDNPNKAVRNSIRASLWELMEVSLHYPEGSLLRPLYNRLIARSATLVNAHEEALDQLLKADDLIGNIYGSQQLVSIELAERYAEVYDDLSSSIFNQWHKNISEEDSSNTIWAALGAADRGLFQAAIQRHQQKRSHTNHEADVMPGAVYIPQRFQSLNGSIVPLAFEAKKNQGAASVGGVNIIYYQQLEQSLRAWVLLSNRGFAVFDLQATRSQVELLSKRVRQTMINGIAGVQGTKLELSKILSEVAELVLPPLEEVLKADSPEILIIPDGSLNLIPFDALILKDGQPLIKKAVVRMAPSLAFLKLQAQYLQFGTIKELMDNNQQSVFAEGASTHELILRRKFDKVSLIFNPITAKNGPVFNKLDDGEKEVSKEIVKIAVTHRGKDASEHALTKALASSKIVHVVAHANSLLGLNNWQSSYIALSPTKNSNGFLTATEILSLPQFNTELIVLSACDSGSGSISSSEGVLALNVAFLERGAQSVIASLWPVADDIPKMIFPQFYEQWLSPQFIAKASKAQALRSAKLQLISNGFEPWDWAAFQIYGAR